MGGTKPGADELETRDRLIAMGVGPDAVPPMPAERPRDWLDDILDSPAEPAPAPAPEQLPAEPKPTAAKKTKPKSSGKKRKKRRKKGKQAYDPLAARSPRQSLADAWHAIPPRLKWLAYHASAAYMGWSIGLVGWSTYVTGWIADTGLIGVQATFWYGTAACTFLLYRRTRRWWWPVAWLAAIPATSTVVGALLYAPTT